MCAHDHGRSADCAVMTLLMPLLAGALAPCQRPRPPVPGGWSGTTATVTGPNFREGEIAADSPAPGQFLHGHWPRPPGRSFPKVASLSARWHRDSAAGSPRLGP